MSHLATMKSDPGNPGVIYLVTDPSMAPVMGGFGPAKFVGNNPPVKGASYAIADDDLPRFQVYCANRSVRLVDTRDDRPEVGTPRARPPWAERPLPECRECGQPAQRGARIEFCPNCGDPWDPVEVGPSSTRHEVVTATCGSCMRETPAAYSHCTRCGAPLA